MATFKLSNWSVQHDNSPYTAPEAIIKYLVGIRDSDNKRIRTSYYVRVNGIEVTTSSGSVYILGEVDPEYRQWLFDHNIPFDINNPIK